MRDQLASWLCLILGVVWAVHMIAQTVRGEAPPGTDWAILPTGSAALLAAAEAAVFQRYTPRHRQEEA